jgi:hypothetical protein
MRISLSHLYLRSFSKGGSAMGSLKVTKRKQRALTGLVAIVVIFITIMAFSAQVSAELHPADTDEDYRISLAELTAYAAAWKGGTAWPTAPNPIPQAYVTNAESLWKAGEAYSYDATKNPPWVPAGITEEQRMKALDDVSAKWNSITATDPTQQNQEMVSFLATRPEFEAYGISDDNDSVWARFTDGRLLIIFDPGTPESDSDVPMQDLGVPQASPAGSGLPENKDVFIYSALNYPWPNPAPQIAGMLEKNGYINKGKVGQVQVSDLRNIKDAAVLYINSHGRKGLVKYGDWVYAILTNTPVDLESDVNAGRSSDWGAQRLAYMLKRWEFSVYYGVTAKFFKDYATFGKNGFAFIDGCRSDETTGFKQVFVDKNVVYAGWNNSVGEACATDIARYVFDRLLGANEVKPETPPQRPFDYEAVMWELRKEDANWCNCPSKYGPECKAQLIITPEEDGNFQILAPSLYYLDMLEFQDRLGLSGIFGDEDTNAKVTVGGQDCPIIPGTWQHKSPEKFDLIYCKINRTGAGSAGDVKVEIKGHESNIVPLTEWKGNLVYSIAPKGSTEENGGLKATAEFEVRLRGDAHGYRPKPGSERFFSFKIDETAESKGTWSAKGHYKDVTWSGEGNLVAANSIFSCPNCGNTFKLFIAFPFGFGQGRFHFQSGFSDGPYLHVETKDAKEDYYFTSGNADLQPEFTLNLGGDYSIKEGKLTLETDSCYGVEEPCTATLQWNKMMPTPGTVPTENTPGDPWPLASANYGKETLTAGSGVANRDLPDCYNPSASSSVATSVTPGGATLAYAMEDSPPAGWTMGNIGSGGVWDNVTKKVKWGLFFDSAPRTLTYQVTPLAGDTEVKTFSGTVSFDGTNAVIGEESSLGLCSGTETVSVPSIPAGPVSGTTGTSYSYTTGGSTSSLGHQVEYQFDWRGDGSDLSGWGSATQSKTWSAAGSYNVKAQARCKTDMSIISTWSSAFTVNITAAPAPDLTGQWVSLKQTCRNTRSSKQCKLAGSFTVQNSGNKDTSSSFYLSIHLSQDNVFSSGDDTLLKQVSVGKMKKGASKKVNLSVNLAPGATVSGKYVIAVIDSQSVITESNKNNNQIVYGPMP